MRGIKNKVIILSDGSLGKICSSCKQAKPFCEYGKDNHRWDGINRKCKECARAYEKLYRPKSKIRAKKRREIDMAKGVCRWCRGPKDRPDKIMCATCREKNNKWNRDKRLFLRKTVYDYYGNKCACCGETEPLFLTIDHINENGAEFRKKMKGSCTYRCHRWIINNNFPDTVQILCRNCNTGKHMNGGICPHKKGGSDGEEKEVSNS